MKELKFEQVENVNGGLVFLLPATPLAKAAGAYLVAKAKVGYAVYKAAKVAGEQ